MTRTRNLATKRPRVFLNIAMTADGKLAPVNRQFVPFTSKRDEELLHELRTRADAVMAGARTVDSAEVTMGPGGARYQAMRKRRGLREFNLRIVVSGSGTLNPEAAIFRARFSPVIVLVTKRASARHISRLEKAGAIVHVCGTTQIHFKAALKWLHREWGVNTLLCEGGGEINDALLREDLVDEIFVTLAPKIFGGRTAPTLADGLGATLLSGATPLKLKNRKRVGDEMFLHYIVTNTSPPT